MFNIQMRMRINAQQQIYMVFGGRKWRRLSGKYLLLPYLVYICYMWHIGHVLCIYIWWMCTDYENIVLYPGNEPDIWTFIWFFDAEVDDFTCSEGFDRAAGQQDGRKVFTLVVWRALISVGWVARTKYFLELKLLMFW